MPNKLLNSIGLIVCFALKCNAQFLDNKKYLVDSIEIAKISNDDKLFLDSQLNDYSSTNSDTVKIQTLAKIVENLHDEKIWVKYNRLMNTIATKKIKSTGGREYFVFKAAQSLALNNLGYYYFNYSSNYNLALSYYEKGLKINEEINNYRDLVASYSNVGNVYQNWGDLNKALEYYQKSTNLEDKVSDKLLFLAPFNNIAQIYVYLNDTIRAIQTLKKALLLSSASEDKFLKGSLLHNIGVLSYYSRKEPGLGAIRKALELRIQIGDKKGIVQSNLSLAGIETKNKNYVLAKKLIMESAGLIKELQNFNLDAQYFYQLGNLEEMLGNETEAINNLEKSVAVYQKFSLGIDLSNALKNLISLYGHDDTKHALKKLKAYELYQNVMSNIDKTSGQKLLLRQKYESEMKVNEAKFLLEKQLEEEKNLSDKHKQQLILSSVLIILVIVLVFSFFIYRALKENKKKNKIISEQKTEVEKQKHLVEEKHKDITDSINYAQKIQTSLIVSEKTLASKVDNVFVLFKPRDIVSGDFYWYGQKNGFKLLAVADCTGHGVPGAFMSMIGITLLNQIVNEKGIVSPAEILNKLREGIISSLNQTNDESNKRDGMDVSVIAWNVNELIYAGANNSAIAVVDKQIIELKPNKQPIGLHEKQTAFTEQRLELKKIQSIYLYTDGITDQFGGDQNKKIKLKVFKEWLIEIAGFNSAKQKQELNDKFNKWKQSNEQTDDVLVIGIKA